MRYRALTSAFYHPYGTVLRRAPFTMSSPCTESGLLKRRLMQVETEMRSTRFRKVIDYVAEEYVCPITAELPFDPVTAEDMRKTAGATKDTPLRSGSSSGRGRKSSRP